MTTKGNEIVRFLEQEPSRAYCHDCLEKALDVSAMALTISTMNLADTNDDRVDVRMGWCSECLRREQVTQARRAW